MDKLYFITMLVACGVEHKEDGKLYIENTSKIANGEFKSYFPKFMGFGKSDKISTIITIVDGELMSWKRYNKFGDVAEYWDK